MYCTSTGFIECNRFEQSKQVSYLLLCFLTFLQRCYTALVVYDTRTYTDACINTVNVSSPILHAINIQNYSLYYSVYSEASRSYEVGERLGEPSTSQISTVRSSELALQVLVACIELLTVPPPMTSAESHNAGPGTASQSAPEQHTRALLATLSSRYVRVCSSLHFHFDPRYSRFLLMIDVRAFLYFSIIS